MSVPRTVLGFNAGHPYAVGGFDAGSPIRDLYQDANRLYTILPDTCVVLPDTRADSWGLAWYRGLTDDGQPQFAVRDDVSLNTKIAYHEAGHAFEDMLRRATGATWWNVFSIGSVDILGRYWTFRRFPGLWQDRHIESQVTGDWGLIPSESWAEAFSAAVSGFVQSEWTWPYGNGELGLPIGPGNTYDPVSGALRAREFFLNLMYEIAPQEEDDMFTDADRALLQRVKDLLEAEGPKVWTARGQRGLDVETGKQLDVTRKPVDPRIDLRA